MAENKFPIWIVFCKNTETGLYSHFQLFGDNPDDVLPQVRSMFFDKTDLSAFEINGKKVEKKSNDVLYPSKYMKILWIKCCNSMEEYDKLIKELLKKYSPKMKSEEQDDKD